MYHLYCFCLPFDDMTHVDLSFSQTILTHGCWFVHLWCMYRQETSGRLDHNMSKTVDKCLLYIEEKLAFTQFCLWMMFNLCWKSCQKVTHSEMGILFSLSHSVFVQFLSSQVCVHYGYFYWFGPEWFIAQRCQTHSSAVEDFLEELTTISYRSHHRQS